MNISKVDKMHVAKVMLNHASTIVIHSGNIINWYTLKQRVSQNSSEELLETLECALTAWTSSIGNELPGIQEPLSRLDVRNNEFMYHFGDQPRENFKITAKIFLAHWRPYLIREAVTEVCSSLGISKLDTVIASFPVTIVPGVEENESIVQQSIELDKVKLIWKEMEAMVEKEMVTVIGVTDFDKGSLQELHDSATVKPSIDQICMANCCDVPSDLLEFSKQYDIELLSHNDLPEILSESSLQKMCHRVVPDANLHEMSLSYAVRYSVVVKCRGIIEAKGYMVGTEKKSTGNGIENYRPL